MAEDIEGAENAQGANGQDEVGEVQASHWYEKYKNLPVIDFTRYDANSWVRLDEANITDLPLLNNRSINDMVEPFCKEFDQIPQSEIFTNVTPLVADFGAYLTQAMIQKLAYPVVCYFPPCIPRLHPSIPSLTILLARILHTTSDPKKFIYFMTIALFQKVWTTKSCLINNYLLSICRCTIEDKGNYWAYIDRDRHFCLYETTSKGCHEVKSIMIQKAYSSTDKTTINILDLNQKNVCQFKPIEKDQIQLWDLIYSRQKVPFPFYLLSGDEFFPEILYRSYYTYITANDSVFVQALLKSTILDPKVWEGVVRCHIHANKMVFLAESVFAFTFNDSFELANDSFELPTHLLLFARALGKIYFQQYFDDFFNKVSAIVDFHDDLDLSDITLVDVKLTEKILFNVMKYIMQGAVYVPKEWRIILSTLRMYLNTRYNSQALTFLGLSAFFGRGIIVPFFQENVKFTKAVSVQHPGNFPVFGYLLSVPFCLNIYSGTTDRFKGYNRRLENHFFPRWWAFLNNLADFEEDFTFSPPDNKSISYALDKIIRPTMNETFAALVKDTIVSLVDPNIRAASVPGWNLAVIVSRFFVHCYDPCEKVTKKKKAVVKTKPVKLPALPMFKGGSGGGGMRGMPIAPHVNFNEGNSFEGTGDFNMNSFFIPRSIPTPNMTMSLPDLPPAAKFNPIIYKDDDLPPTTGSDEDNLTITPKELQNKMKKKEKKGLDAKNIVNNMDMRSAGFQQPVQPPPSPKKNSNHLPPPPKKALADNDDDDTDDDMKLFLKTIGSDDEGTNTRTQKKHGKMVPVDPSKVKQGENQPKLYKKVKK